MATWATGGNGGVFATDGGTRGRFADGPLLKAMTDREIDDLLLSATTLRSARHQIVFCAGEKVQHLYLVQSGSFKLIRHSEEGKELIVSLVGPGECFGALVNPIESFVLSQALEDSVCYIVGVSAVRRAVSRSPEFAMALLIHSQRRERVLRRQASLSRPCLVAWRGCS